MSMNTINNIVKRFADKFIVYSGICYVIKHSKINCDSKHYGRRSASCLIFEESYFSQPKNILIIYVKDPNFIQVQPVWFNWFNPL